MRSPSRRLGLYMIKELEDVTQVYSPFAAWFYETVVAPAVYPSRWIIDERFLAHLPAGARILDVGSGGGRFGCYMADQRPDITVIGCDPSQAQIRRATAAARRFGDRVEFRSASALALPFEDASFHGVISYGSIKHWPDRAKGLAECMRVLRPGGPFLVTEADRGATWKDLTAFVRNYRAPRFMYNFNLAMFTTWVAGQSVDIVDFQELSSLLPLDAIEVGRVAGFPLVFMSGKRRTA